MQVIVAGGGIGGLALALSLHQAGIAVRVYEAVRDPAPFGLGINLQPSAVRELSELGLADDLARIAIATRHLSFFNKLGQPVWSELRGRLAGYNWPHIRSIAASCRCCCCAPCAHALAKKISAAAYD
ncbi:MAG TPA: FAD-dependent monooxygenase [Beijerinckiaceae bacterium]|nr:FAD-dependent monooxygenase [Beijerinckiaceae bacterium]